MLTASTCRNLRADEVKSAFGTYECASDNIYAGRAVSRQVASTRSSARDKGATPSRQNLSVSYQSRGTSLYSGTHATQDSRFPGFSSSKTSVSRKHTGTDE